MEFITNNWEHVLLAMYVIEKIVKISPTKSDDVIFDMVLGPVFNAIKGKK